MSSGPGRLGVGRSLLGKARVEVPAREEGGGHRGRAQPAPRPIRKAF